MQVKNKIIEQLDASAKADFYTMLQDETILICKAKEGIPNMDNVEKCGDGFLVFKPTKEQEPYCCGRVIPLYVYFPDMKDDAEMLSDKTEAEALGILDFVKEQYDPKEVYDYLMQGLKDNTLHNLIEWTDILSVSDEKSGKKIEIVDLYCQGVPTDTLCSINTNGKQIKTISCPYEGGKEKAYKFFAKQLTGEDKALFERLVLNVAEM